MKLRKKKNIEDLSDPELVSIIERSFPGSANSKSAMDELLHRNVNLKQEVRTLARKRKRKALYRGACLVRLTKELPELESLSDHKLAGIIMGSIASEEEVEKAIETLKGRTEIA